MKDFDLLSIACFVTKTSSIQPVQISNGGHIIGMWLSKVFFVAWALCGMLTPF